MRRLRATVMQWPVPGQATGCCPIQQKTVRVFQTGPAVEFMLTEARSTAWDKRTGAASESIPPGCAFNCYGVAGNGSGISALSAENCYGVSNNAGITATSATNCYGSNVGPIGDSINGFGINANTATGCYGVSVGSIGLQAKAAINCTGTTGGDGTGIYGINTSTAQNCYGTNTGSSNAFGMRAIIASFCYGTGSSSASGGGGISVNLFARTALTELRLSQRS